MGPGRGGGGAYRERPRLEWPQDEEALTYAERGEQRMAEFKCGNQQLLKEDLNPGNSEMWIDTQNGQVFNQDGKLVGKCTHLNRNGTYRANSFQAYGHPNN